MAANSSSSFSSSSFSSAAAVYECLDIKVSAHIFSAMTFFYLLFFFPLCVFVLLLGLQRWRSASPAVNSNSDVFTYNIVVMEMAGVLGCCSFTFGFYANMQQLILVGVYFYHYVTPGQMLFHILTCGERYLAVVHPVLYLGFRHTGGVRIRNLSVGCVWVSSTAWAGLTALYKHKLPTIQFAAILALSVVITCFCSLSVLRALTRSGPGEARRERADQVKRRAFHTILAISGALLLRFGVQLLCVLVDFSTGMSYTGRCVMLLSAVWSTLPSSYIMPLLFLHRAGKLACFRTESGPGSE